MISITSEITMDLLRPSSPQIVYAKQGDTLARGVVLKLQYNGTPWTVPDGVGFTVCYIKPDNTGGKYEQIKTADGTISAVESDGNALTVHFPHEAFSCPGTVKCEVQMASDPCVLTTFTFYINVQASPEQEIESEDYFNVASIAALRADLGDPSELKTETKDSVVDALNEVVGKLDGGTASGSAQLPIASAGASNGDNFAATGSDLPTVATTGDPSSGRHIGKGSQIVFIQRTGSANTTTAPTLSLNGGEAIPIRLRAAANQDNSSTSTEATVDVPVGTLMNGVPYTMTFCGLYWLVDSAIGMELACAGNADQAKVMRAVAEQMYGLTDANAIAFPVVNTMDDVPGEIGTAFIERTQTEIDEADTSGYVNIPSVGKVQEMIAAALSQFYNDYLV